MAGTISSAVPPSTPGTIPSWLKNNPGGQQLLAAIQAQAPNVQTEEALIVGAFGESNFNPNSSGSGGYGAFGFTSPQYTDPSSPNYVPPGASPAQQVAAILPSYEGAQSLIPSGLSGAPAAEYQALEAEAPLYSAQEELSIATTGATTQYGANTSYHVQNWSQVQEALGAPVTGGQTTPAGSPTAITTAFISGSVGKGKSQAPAVLIQLDKFLNPISTQTSKSSGGGVLGAIDGWLTGGVLGAIAGGSGITGTLNALLGLVPRVVVAVPGLILLLGAVAAGVLGAQSSKTVTKLVPVAKTVGKKIFAAPEVPAA
jgi:hypothetical protein